MRRLAVLSLLVALIALAVAGFALRQAHRARHRASKAEAKVARVEKQLRTTKRQLAEVHSTVLAVRALCHAARHPAMPHSTNYTVRVSRVVIHRIAASCDAGHVR